MSERAFSDYLYLHLVDRVGDLDPSDAISLGFLADRKAGRSDRAELEYYEAAYTALCEGLGFRPYRLGELEEGAGAAGSGELRETAEGDLAEDEEREGAPWDAARGERDPWLAGMAFRQLARMRRAAIAFADEWGDTWEGDLWGRTLEDPRLAAPLRTACRWYQARRREVVDGLPAFDDAICALLGWDPGARVSYAKLVKEHGFPVPDFEP